MIICSTETSNDIIIRTWGNCSIIGINPTTSSLIDTLKIKSLLFVFRKMTVWNEWLALKQSEYLLYHTPQRIFIFPCSTGLGKMDGSRSDMDPSIRYPISLVLISPFFEANNWISICLRKRSIQHWSIWPYKVYFAASIQSNWNL